MKNTYGLGISTTFELDDKHISDFKKTNIIIDAEEEIIIVHNETKSICIDNELDELHAKYCDYLTIKIPDNFKSKRPITIKKDFTGNASNHTIIIVGKNSEAIIIVEMTSNSKTWFASEFVDIVVEENSRIRYNELNNLKNTYLYAKRKGIAGENSSIDWLTCDVGGFNIFSEIKTKLDGRNSTTNTSNIYYSSNNNKLDIDIEAEHANEGTKSNLKSTGVLRNSESIVRGLIKINANAPNSNGYQKSDALILENSRAVAIPDLLIDNDKVKCSHGSTITRIDEEKLFYMQSRGLNREEAELEMIQGFIEPGLKASPEILPRFLSVIMEKIRKEETNV